MASVVRHRTGNWEIRESVRTARGPRSRTLASFRTLTPGVLEHARRRAERPFDAEAVTRAAARAGAAVQPAPERDAALALLAALDRGARLAPGLRALLGQALGTTAGAGDATPPAPQAQAAAAWSRATPREHGEALVDLLLLADALPAPAERPQRFPRLCSRPAEPAPGAA